MNIAHSTLAATHPTPTFVGVSLSVERGRSESENPLPTERDRPVIASVAALRGRVSGARPDFLTVWPFFATILAN